MNDYIFKVRTDGDIVDLEGRVIGHINLEYIKSIAERSKGKWIDYYYPYFEVPGIKCSICNKDVEYWQNHYEKPNFCPNCGADMRGDNQ